MVIFKLETRTGKRLVDAYSGDHEELVPVFGVGGQVVFELDPLLEDRVAGDHARDVLDVVQVVEQRRLVNVPGVLVESLIDSLVHAHRDDPGLDLLVLVVLFKDEHY